MKQEKFVLLLSVKVRRGCDYARVEFMNSNGTLLSDIPNGLGKSIATLMSAITRCFNELAWFFGDVVMHDGVFLALVAIEYTELSYCWKIQVKSRDDTECSECACAVIGELIAQSENFIAKIEAKNEAELAEILNKKLRH
ncbi:hypothetical protein QV08_11615 [Gallibacterium salpingitidis]|uniref:hypothetical protein n=1 Tax=Gallibacterium salpingitidis TaxID=505341 RepID=UPI00080504E5|nr:hypothetical protein [Gallibacterium salpingitidis]OBX05778.1 hypothetical protein QV08_11615 [Gallibacterium salpingitidis]